MTLITTPGSLLVGTATSAPVTNWPVRLVLVAVVIAVILGVLWLMRRGWRNRLERHAHLPEPADIRDREGIAAGATNAASDTEMDGLAVTDGLESLAIEGVYLGSVISGDWLDRIAAHGLGTRSRVEVMIDDDGIEFHRQGARSFRVRPGDVRGIRHDRGIAGKAFEKDAVVVLTWMLGDTAVDTGIRPDRGEDGQQLVNRIGQTITESKSTSNLSPHPEDHGSEPAQ